MKFLESAYLNSCSSLSETSCCLSLSLLSLKIFVCSLIFVCLPIKFSLFSSISCRSCCSSTCSRARSLEETHRRTHHTQGQKGGGQQVGTHIRSKYSCGACTKSCPKRDCSLYFMNIYIYNINLLIKHSIVFIMTPYEVSLTDRPVSLLLDVDLLLGQSSLDLSLDSSSQKSTIWTLQPWIPIIPVLLVLCEFQDFVSGSILIQFLLGQMLCEPWRRELRSLFDTEMTKISFSVLSLYPDWLGSASALKNLNPGL